MIIQNKLSVQSKLAISICITASVFFLMCKNRAFLIGSIFSLWYLLLIIFRTRARVIVFLGLPILIFVIIGCAIYLKTDSSLGRILIYKISWEIFKNNRYTGIGLGNFNIAYMQYQSTYFKDCNYSTKELLLADNTFHLYNDYLQFIIELGFVGIVVVSIIFIIAIQLLIKVIKSDKKYSFPFLLALSLLVSMAIAACFTFVFSRFWYQILFSIAILTLIYECSGKSVVKQKQKFILHVLTTVC